MQDMLIAGVALFVALMSLGRFLWPRFGRSVEKGVELVRKELAGSRTMRGEVKVELARVKPLSEEMVKEAAAAEGYTFSGKAAGYRSRSVLTFDAQPDIAVEKKHNDR